MDSEEEFRLTYAKECFDNMHSISRFIDGKTAALTSLVLLVQGGMAYVINHILKLDEVQFDGVESLQCMGKLALVLAVLSFAASIFSIIFCIMTNMARKQSTTRRTLLFPTHVSKYSDLDQASHDLLVMMKAVDCNKAMQEYADQLANLGNIVAQKGIWFNRGIYAFSAQSVLGLLALAFFLFNALVR